jgi:hypothetical protein
LNEWRVSDSLISQFAVVRAVLAAYGHDAVSERGEGAEGGDYIELRMERIILIR